MKEDYNLNFMELVEGKKYLRKDFDIDMIYSVNHFGGLFRNGAKESEYTLIQLDRFKEIKQKKKIEWFRVYYHHKDDDSPILSPRLCASEKDFLNEWENTSFLHWWKLESIGEFAYD